jgi:hypothetical protein
MKNAMTCKLIVAKHSIQPRTVITMFIKIAIAMSGAALIVYAIGKIVMLFSTTKRRLHKKIDQQD